MESGKFRFKRDLEDIHMNVEVAAFRPDRPGRRTPAHGALAQTIRSRPISSSGCAMRSTISTRRSRPIRRRSPKKALKHAATVMPGFTHLQTAQPVTFGHHLLAYVEMARARPRAFRRRAQAAE